MGQSNRIQLLSITCFVIFLLYWFVCIIVFFLRYCWKPQDFWLNTDVLLNPFWSFTVLFSTLSIWVIAELFVLIQRKGSKAFGISVLTILFLFFIFFWAGQFTLWQMLHILKGELTTNDYWYNVFGGRSRIAIVKDYLLPLSWSDFIYKERCGNGLDLYNMTENELRELSEKYDDIIEKALSNEIQSTR